MADPTLQGLIGRVETDCFGRILMSPPPAYDHGGFQYLIGKHLEERMQSGRVTVESPISTSGGVRAADVAWASDAFLA